MSSFYQKVQGTIEPGKLARATDIHQIQSSIQESEANIIKAIAGTHFIKGGDEDTFKLTPTPEHIDQSNLNYDSASCWLTFGERNIRQLIRTQKSEINTITVTLKNTSDYQINVTAEIHNAIDNNLLSTQSTIVPKKSSEIDVNFNFNLKHLPVGEYYFVLKGISLSNTESFITDSDTVLSTPTIDDFEIKYDITGSYNQGLSVSYDGGDNYDNINVTSGTSQTTVYADLYFKESFSNGITYLIEPGVAVIMGENVPLLDTHITIRGPSSQGDRIDMVYISPEGKALVKESAVNSNKPDKPTTTEGLIIAYITTYKNITGTWTCSKCDTTVSQDEFICPKCGTLNNTTIPLIEQDDENLITRERDILERLRRLEKKYNFMKDRNTPSRIIYNCVLDTVNNLDSSSNALSPVSDSDGNVSYKVSNILTSNFKWTIKRNLTTTEPNTYLGKIKLEPTAEINIDTDNGIIDLNTNTYEEASQKITTVPEDKKKPEYRNNTNEILYTLYNSNLGQFTSEYPLLNFTLDKPIFVKSITPMLTKFKNMESFSILIFRNEHTFNKYNNTGSSWTKQFDRNNKNLDSQFPDVYVSEQISLKDVQSNSDGVQEFSEAFKFKVNQHFDAGTYSMLIYGEVKSNSKQGVIYIDQFDTLDGVQRFGTAAKCNGPATPSTIILEKNNIYNQTWDCLMEYNLPQYAERGTIVSSTISTDKNIKTISCYPNFEVSDGCSVQIYVSNDGGRTYTDISKTLKTIFNNASKEFRWKIILMGNGEKTPVIKYNNDDGYAIKFEVGQSDDDVSIPRYANYLETRVLDANYINALLLGDANISNAFERWEFVRLWAEENEGDITTDVYISYDDTEVLTPYADLDKSTKLNWSTIVSDLTMDDFSKNSINYSNYDADVEYDEHNYEFSINENDQYNDTQGEIISTGIDGLTNINPSTSIYNIDMSHFIYPEVVTTDSNGKDLGTLKSYTKVIYAKELTNESTASYYNSKTQSNANGDETYNSKAILIGKSFPQGIDMTSYNKLSLDIIPSFISDIDDVTNTPPETIPANLLEVVIALNTTGSIDDSDVSYGKAYPITTELKNNAYNTVYLTDFSSDVYAYGDVKSIGIRIRDTAQDSNPKLTLKCKHSDTPIGETQLYTQGDSIGIANIKLYKENIMNLLPLAKASRENWITTSSSARINVTKLDGETSYPVNPMVTVDCSNKYAGTIGYIKTSANISQYNTFNVTFFSNLPFKKGEFVIHLCSDEQGQEIIQSLYLPSYNKINSNQDAWAYTVNGTYESGVSAKQVNMINVWFKKRTTEKHINSIRIDRVNINNDTSDAFADAISLKIGVIRGFTSSSINSMGSKIKLRVYPHAESTFKFPTIRKFGVVYRIG